MKRVWWLQVLIAFDQFLNAILFGWADETFSARCYRRGTLQRNGFFRVLQAGIDGVFFWTVNHCRKSYDAEMERTQLPRMVRLDQKDISENAEP